MTMHRSFNLPEETLRVSKEAGLSKYSPRKSDDTHVRKFTIISNEDGVLTSVSRLVKRDDVILGRHFDTLGDVRDFALAQTPKIQKIRNILSTGDVNTMVLTPAGDGYVTLKSGTLCV